MIADNIQTWKCPVIGSTRPDQGRGQTGESNREQQSSGAGILKLTPSCPSSTQSHLCQLILKYCCHRELMAGSTASDEEDSASLSQKNRQCLILCSLREALSGAGQRRMKVAEVGGESSSCFDVACVLFSPSEQVHCV